MTTLFKTLSVFALLAFLAPGARAQELDINKRGAGDKDKEKAWAEKVGIEMVKAAQKATKGHMMQKFEQKKIKEGREEWHIEMGWKGGITGTKYSSDIVLQVDTENKDKYEVLRVDYKDNSKVAYSRKGVENMLPKLNGR
jgi:hypothetical protein